MNLNNNNQGYTLFEVMIAILVVSFGMIALGGLMINSLRFSKESANRFVATQQLYEMTDRMRSNNKGVSAGYYDSVIGIPAAVNCRATACGTNDHADFDASEWNTKNSRVLPRGLGLVQRDGLGFLISVQWTETETGNPVPVNRTITMKVTP